MFDWVAVFFFLSFFPLTCQVWSVMFSCVVFLVCCVVHVLRLSPTIVTQNTRPICPLGSATGKRFHTYFLSSPTIRPKRQHSLQMGLEERGYPNLGYVSPDT